MMNPLLIWLLAIPGACWSYRSCRWQPAWRAPLGCAAFPVSSACCPAAAIGVSRAAGWAIVGVMLFVFACSDDTSATNCRSHDEARYFAARDEIMARHADASGRFASHLEVVRKDLSLLHDAEWRAGALFILADKSSTADGLRALNPPGSLRSIHHDDLKLALEIDAATLMFVSWMDTGHLETLDEAILAAKRTGDLINETYDNIDRFCR